MNRNVEIKAKLNDRTAVEGRVRELATDGPHVLKQQDAFFTSRGGRLKLRTIEGQTSELIYYERDDSPDPKPSNYLLAAVPDPASMRAILQHLADERGIVRKTRTLYLIGQTRVHLDAVEGLGDFLELEVVLAPHESVEAGRAIAREIMQKLGIGVADLVQGAYLDLLQSLPAKNEQR